MPTYQYACSSCGEQLEVVQSFTDPSLTVHDACGGALRKKYGAVGVVFKGTGFYRNDSRGAPSESSGDTGSGDQGSADKGSGDKGSGDKRSGDKGSTDKGSTDKGAGPQQAGSGGAEKTKKEGAVAGKGGSSGTGGSGGSAGAKPGAKPAPASA